ncbi:hypothetical protein JF729_18555, partial [Mycobacterium intracellulare]|nr:hypothetical protein [Mycobacterium intracellulare]
MTSTRQHIEDLGDEDWAALAKRVAEDVVADAAQSGTTPPAALAAVAAMTEGELVEHRRRHGPARKRLSPVMQLVAADQRAVIAEAKAQEARQEKLDADAAAEMARAQSAQSAELASAARQRVRDVEAQAARKDAERVEERAAEQQALQQLRGELERARAEHA